MADTHQVTSDPGHKEEFKLKIISPSPEIGPLQFPSISTSCTVAQLKQKISDASETKVPLPSQQRLIYRGHVLAQEHRTLKEVFGQDTVGPSIKDIAASKLTDIHIDRPQQRTIDCSPGLQPPSKSRSWIIFLYAPAESPTGPFTRAYPDKCCHG